MAQAPKLGGLERSDAGIGRGAWPAGATGCATARSPPRRPKVFSQA